jgi:uncharacterized membrane protein (DUF106 family)
MKMQPEIMRRQTEASGGMMKPMVFLVIVSWPIFIWLRQPAEWGFLFNVDHYYFTVPWAPKISLYFKPFLMQAWLWLYLVFSIVLGQILRQGLKLFSWSDWWKNIKSKIFPTLRKN